MTQLMWCSNIRPEKAHTKYLLWQSLVATNNSCVRRDLAWWQQINMWSRWTNCTNWKCKAFRSTFRGNRSRQDCNIIKNKIKIKGPKFLHFVQPPYPPSRRWSNVDQMWTDDLEVNEITDAKWKYEIKLIGRMKLIGLISVYQLWSLDGAIIWKM